MLRSPTLLAIAVLLAAGVACDSGRRSSAGFRLPDDGDAERGKTAFVSLGCNNCHEVTGVTLPAPTAQPPVQVVLGGETAGQMTDGYLVTSIINPSYRLAHYPKEEITSGGQSRMPHYAHTMTVRQLTDVVAFLQTHYTVRRMPSRYSYY